MISMVIFDKKEEEVRELTRQVKDLAAKLTEDYWNIETSTSLEEVSKIFENHSLVDFSCYDITLKETLEKLVEIRKEYGEMGLLLIADSNISPLAYLRPSIKADALLMRPFSYESIRETLTELFLDHLSINRNDTEKMYVIESKEGRTAIPFHKIYYFEAREKKVFIRTKNEEYGFYAALEQLNDQLPPNFLRCHRSFIVNSDKILQIKLSAGCILLTEEFEVPLSRSYKPMWKEFGKSHG